MRVSIIRIYYHIISKLSGGFLQKQMTKLRYEHFSHSAMRVTKRLAKGRTTTGVGIWDLVLQQEEKVIPACREHRWTRTPVYS